MHPVAGLKPEQFRILEDGQPRTVTSATSSGGPVCIGFVIDKSGSMRGNLFAVAGALRTFTMAGNPQNRSFVVAFNDDPILQQGFTSNPALIERAVDNAEPRGGTALYNAIIASANYLAKAAGCERRALVIVSDGEDNESRHTLEYTVVALQQAGNPFLYAVGLPNAQSAFTSRGRRTLQELAESTGGLEFVAKNLKDLKKIMSKLAGIIRSQYTVSYVLSNSQPSGLAKIAVQVDRAAHSDWLVRANIPVSPASSPSASDTAR
jgi:VWFA-related protein